MWLRPAVLALMATGCAPDKATVGGQPSPSASPMHAASPSPERSSGGDGDEFRRTVLVELFTSEGCSSCPPADQLIASLAQDDSVEIAAVAFHVDYWDYLGWSDRFSSATWTRRQHAYADAFDTNRVYTPQLLFDGVDQRVGTNERRARAAIRRAAARPPAVELDVKATVDGGAIAVDVQASDTAEPGDPEGLVMVALVARSEATEVRRGENAGRTLDHIAVALDLVAACRLDGEARQTCHAELTTDRDPEDLELVAFVQHPLTMSVAQATRVRL